MYGLCFLLLLSTVFGKIVEDPIKIKEALDNFEVKLTEKKGVTGDIADGSFFSNSRDQLCDTVITEPGLTYCDKCLNQTNSVSCNFAIILNPKAKIRLALKVEEGTKEFEIKVFDGMNEGYNKLDAAIGERKDFVFESTAAAMYIHIDGRRFTPNTHSFGFSVQSLEPITGEATTGCTFVAEIPNTVQLPTQSSAGANLECYYKLTKPSAIGLGNIRISLPACSPGKTDSCYLRFLRLYDGQGINKIRLNSNEDTSTVQYTATQPVVIMEYFGCPLSSPVNIEFTA